jgi:hypothetical protein
MLGVGNMATEVKSYHILLYGGPDGYQINRAQIQLSDGAGKILRAKPRIPVDLQRAGRRSREVRAVGAAGTAAASGSLPRANGMPAVLRRYPF